MGESLFTQKVRVLGDMFPVREIISVEKTHISNPSCPIGTLCEYDDKRNLIQNSPSEKKHNIQTPISLNINNQTTTIQGSVM